MIPLRITATMREPVVYAGDGMHLDGIVAFGVFRSLSRSESQALPPISGPWAQDLDLPLAKWTAESTGHQAHPNMLDDDGKIWGWCASAVHAEWLESHRHHVRKMPDTGAMATWAKDKSVNTAGGQLKACNIPYAARSAHRLVWYCVGDASALRLVLGHVRSVGKLGNHGMGRVMDWAVEECGEDWSVERDGELTRRMPASYRPTVVPRLLSVRAPYHHPSRVVPAVAPIYDRLRPAEVT